MNHIKLFDSWWSDNMIANIMTVDEIEDYLLEYIDYYGDVQIEKNYQQSELLDKFDCGRRQLPIYKRNVPFGSLCKVTPNESIKGETYIYLTVNHPELRIKGNLDTVSYTRDTILDLFKKFVRISKWVVNIDIVILRTNSFSDPLSNSVVRIQFKKEVD